MRPRCLGTSQLVRARQSAQSDHQAPVVQIFEPLSTQTSPSRTAEVSAPATSDPPLGSERNWAQIASPRRIGGMCLRFCSSVPKSRRTLMQGAKVGTWIRSGNSCLFSSSLSARWCAGVSSWPPYSFGMQTPASPASKSIRWSARSWATAASSASSDWALTTYPPPSPGSRRRRLSPIHARARSRKSSTLSAGSPRPVASVGSVLMLPGRLPRAAPRRRAAGALPACRRGPG